ncbi:MAG: SdpI family protein [Bacteroidota bacterium]
MEKQSALRYQIVILALIFLPFVLSWVCWNQVPDEVPIHWNAKGEPDRYGHKAINLFLLPGINLMVNGLFWIIPYADPKQNIPQFISTLRKYQIALNVFMLLLYLIILGNSLGYEVPFNQVVPYALFGLLAVLGNFFGKLRPNHFVGIRLPWTMEDEDNWNRTHRLAGQIWLVGSFAGALLYYLLSPVNFLWILFPVLAVLCGGPMIYSFWLFRKKG